MSIRDKYLEALERKEKEKLGIPPESSAARMGRKYREAVARQEQNPRTKNPQRKKES